MKFDWFDWEVVLLEGVFGCLMVFVCGREEERRFDWWLVVDRVVEMLEFWVGGGDFCLLCLCFNGGEVEIGLLLLLGFLFVL